MIWLLQDFELLGILLHAAGLSLEVLALGGLLFLLVVANGEASQRTRRGVFRFAVALAAVQAATTALSLAVLIGNSGSSLRSCLSASFFLSGVAEVVAALALAALMTGAEPSRLRRAFAALAGVCALAASVAQSHAVSRLDHRVLLTIFTALHHLGSAGWIGAMLFLLFALRRSAGQVQAVALARRYSTLAMASVAMLAISGVGMAWLYVGSPQGLYGTTYGVLLSAKIYLFLGMLVLGAGNWRLLRTGNPATPDAALPGHPFLIRLRRFSEAELGFGFTAILAAASLTALPPAVDNQPSDILTLHPIVQRLNWTTPSLTSPPFTALAPATSMAQAVQDAAYSNGSTNDANDRAWSEYNHHWAGLIVLACALLALLARALPRSVAGSVARNWPLLFIGLAVFILLRADPENWPLGPRSFWQSFASPDVLEHRVFALLITLFALFEWAVATGRWRGPRAAYVFPLLLAFGGGALLTHQHGFSDLKEEALADMTHTAIALLGATAGWSRWLELRLPGTRAARMAGLLWPFCLALAGLVLLDYRES